jgi:signal transduction histidine kinase/CheY-like chemotaxis protein
MRVADSCQPPLASSQMRSMLRQFQHETILLTLPGLYFAIVILIAASPQFSDPLHAALPILLLFFLPPAVWGLRKANYLAAAWTLVFGCLALVLLLVTWSHLGPTIILLALPVGLAALFVSLAAGALVAAMCTVLVYAQAATLAPDPVLRLTLALELWSIVGLIWLTQRPLLTTLQWSWWSWERSRDLLEQARDTQVQLKQTLADLADANVQLARLNDVAQELRQIAEDARRAKEQFVANVSHELRTPLNMIIGFIEMITQTPEIYGRSIPPALLADLAIVLRNGQHLSSLIDDVLDLSQIEAGRMALIRERAALSEIIEAAVTAVRPLFDSKGLYLETRVPGDIILYCDPTRIRQVVLNLLSNAGRLTEKGGVCVLAQRDGGDVVVSIADTGPGIAAEDVSSLFQPFHQLDGSIRRRHGGSGLGLAISKSFVELHGGRMWLESSKGVGTTFFFSLPVEPSVPIDSNVLRWFNPHVSHEPRTRRSLAPVPVVRPRLVVLEKGTALQHLLKRYVHDFEFAAVASLDEACTEIERVPAQGLVVNGESTHEVLRQLERAPLPQGTPAIVCSVPGVQQTVNVLGVTDYLVKPISREQLLTTLERLPEVKTVLVVDDEPEIQRLFRRILASARRGYRVLRADDGEQALGILQRERPDLILLDLVMPDMDGFQFLAAKREEPAWRNIPVVVISAQDPTRQPIVSSSLAVTQSGGLSLPQLLDCIVALSGILGTTGKASVKAPHPGVA